MKKSLIILTSLLALQTQGYGTPIYININYPFMRNRGADTWGKRTLPPYTIDGNRSYHYAFMMDFVTN